MRCQAIQEKLEAFTARELAPHLRKKIEGHLRTCSECRDALTRQQRLEALVRSVPETPVPDGFSGRVMARARLADEVPDPVSRSKWNVVGWLAPQRLRLGLVTAAALAAGLLIGVVMGQQTWQHSLGESGAEIQMVEGDPVAASELSLLAGLGDKSLGEVYLGMTRVPNNGGT